MTAMLAYEQMTPEERDRYNALVAHLDDLIAEKKSRERRQEAKPISFDDRRIADRRRE